MYKILVTTISPQGMRTDVIEFSNPGAAESAVSIINNQHNSTYFAGESIKRHALTLF